MMALECASRIGGNGLTVATYPPAIFDEPLPVVRWTGTMVTQQTSREESGMHPWSVDYRGRYEEVTFESEVLKGNPLGDPSRRPLWVYLPPGYEQEPTRRYPSIYLIQGLTGQLDMWRNRTPLRKNFPELADELFAAG